MKGESDDDETLGAGNETLGADRKASLRFSPNIDVGGSEELSLKVHFLSTSPFAAPMYGPGADTYVSDMM